MKPAFIQSKNVLTSHELGIVWCAHFQSSSLYSGNWSSYQRWETLYFGSG